MALNHSPSVVTNGLVLYYDMNNTQKSFKGAPTTNSVTSSDTMTGWNNYYRTLTSSTFITEFGTTGYRFTNQPSWNGVVRGVTIPSTGIYTFSAWFRYLGGSAANNGATVYISGWGGGDSAVSIDKSLVGVWQRKSITLNCTNTSMYLFIISYGGTDNGTGNPDFSSWEVTMPQAEPGTYATPYVNGTRSNTQAIVDLTNNNTITASSLTYAADNTFSFNGTNNYIDAGNLSSIQLPTAITMEAWINPNSTTGLGNIMAKNSNSGYRFRIQSGVLWWYVSGSSAIGGSVPNSSWSHCVVTGDSTGLKAYVNTVLVASNTAAFAPADATTGSLYIGTVSPSSEIFDGKIGVAKIYNRALSATEVSQNFNALRGRYGL